MGILDDLRENRRLARMRLGQDAPELVALKSAPEVRVALVPLMENEFEHAMTEAASLDVLDNGYGVEARDRRLRVTMLYYAVRDTADLTKRVFETPEQLTTELEFVDINYLSEMYDRMVDDSSPALDGLGDEELDTLKKALQQINLNALSGKAWWHLKGFLLEITPMQLTDNSPGFSSILKSIGKNESSESTPGA